MNVGCGMGLPEGNRSTALKVLKGLCQSASPQIQAPAPTFLAQDIRLEGSLEVPPRMAPQDDSSGTRSLLTTAFATFNTDWMIPPVQRWWDSSHAGKRHANFLECLSRAPTRAADPGSPLTVPMTWHGQVPALGWPLFSLFMNCRTWIMAKLKVSWPLKSFIPHWNIQVSSHKNMILQTKWAGKTSTTGSGYTEATQGSQKEQALDCTAGFGPLNWGLGVTPLTPARLSVQRGQHLPQGRPLQDARAGVLPPFGCLTVSLPTDSNTPTSYIHWRML